MFESDGLNFVVKIVILEDLSKVKTFIDLCQNYEESKKLLFIRVDTDRKQVGKM